MNRLVTARLGFEELSARWETARTDVSLADALTAQGDDDGARRALAAAVSVFEDLRSIRDLLAARERLG